MSKPSQLACTRAVLFLLHAGGELAAVRSDSKAGPAGQLAKHHCASLAVPGAATIPAVPQPPYPAVPGYHELDAWPAWHLAAGLRQLAERGVFASASLRF